MLDCFMVCTINCLEDFTFLFFYFLAKTGFFLFLFSCFFQLNYSTMSKEMVSEDDYEIWILPQELQCVDIKNLQSFWSNWCSAEEECNTSCCDVPCILFSTVSGHACHSPLQGCVGTILWPCAEYILKLNRGDATCLGERKCQQNYMYCYKKNVSNVEKFVWLTWWAKISDAVNNWTI